MSATRSNGAVPEQPAIGNRSVPAIEIQDLSQQPSTY